MKIKLLFAVLLCSFTVIEPTLAYHWNYFKINPDYYFSPFLYMVAFNFIVAAFISWSLFYDNIERGFALVIPIGLFLLVFMMFTWLSNTVYHSRLVKITEVTDSFGHYFGYYCFTLIHTFPYVLSGKYRKKNIQFTIIIITIAILVYAVCNYLSYLGIDFLFEGTPIYDNFKYRLSVLRLRYYSDMFLLVYGFYKLELLRKADKTLKTVSA